MADNGTITAKQKRLVKAMLTASTVGDAARSVGIGERTAFRYLAQPAVRAALNDALDAALGQAVGVLVNEVGASVRALADIRDDKTQPGGVRVGAARAILNGALKLYELVNLGDRVARLEELSK